MRRKKHEVYDKYGVPITEAVYYRDGNGEFRRETVYDISLRNYYAGCALARGVGGPLPESAWRSTDIAVRCREAFVWADAMIEQGDKRNG